MFLPGEEKKKRKNPTQDFDAIFISYLFFFILFFLETLPCIKCVLQKRISKGNVLGQSYFSVWAIDIFRAALKKVSEIRKNQFKAIFMGRKLINSNY